MDFTFVEAISRFKISDIGIVPDGSFHIGYRISGERYQGISAFISDTIYNEILITKSWFRVIDIIYLIK